MQNEAIYAFGPFALDPRQRVLSRGDQPLRLTPKEIDVLVALVRRHGELVDKRTLLDEVWPALCVEECNLSQQVASLRRILGDDAREPVFIETVARRGYRFVSPVVHVPPAGNGAETPAPSSAAASSSEVQSGSAPAGRGFRLVHVGAALLLVLGLAGWQFVAHQRARPASVVTSVAVLPLANLTGDSHYDEMAARLTAELLGDLRRVKGLRIEEANYLPEGGHPVLGADALLETALLTGDGRFRLAAELIDERTGRLIWAQVLEDEPASKERVGRKLVREIVGQLVAKPRGEKDSEPPDGSVARHEYDLAREYLERWTPGVVGEALEHFTAAVRADPTFAPALAGLAETYLFGAQQRVLEPIPAMTRAESAARRALALDPRLAEAHGVLGGIAAARWDFASAEEEYRRAIALDPSIGEIRAGYSALLTILDRHDEAVEQGRVARDLDPGCPVTSTTLAAANFHAGRLDEAIDEALAALRVTPGYSAAYDVLGWAHAARGRNSEAIAAFREAVRLSEGSPAYVAALARALARGGAREEAQRLIKDLETRKWGKVTSPLDLAAVFAALGDEERGVRELERAVDEGTPWLQLGEHGVSLAGLHEQDGFRSLMVRLRKAAGRRSVAASGTSETRSGDPAVPTAPRTVAATSETR